MREPRLQAPTAVSGAVSSWIHDCLSIVDAFDSGSRLPKKQHGGVRAAGTVACPLACGICCAWSTLARLVACPCMCVCRGPGFACSDNRCTRLTDDCVAVYWTSLHAPQKLAAMPSPDEVATSATVQDMHAWSALSNRIHGIFYKDGQRSAPKQCTPVHYALADALFSETMRAVEGVRAVCLPYQVDSMICRMRFVASRYLDIPEQP